MIRTIALGALLLVAACSKPEEAPAPAPSASVVPVAATSVAPVASPAVSASAQPVAAQTGDGGATCGSNANMCPLQSWMRLNMQPPMNKPDLPALAAALEQSATFAPAGYTNWASIAKDGAAAAKNGDLQAAKASCRSCHDQYKQKYKEEMRARKI